MGWTQKELADKIDVSPSAITNYENETSHPKEEKLYALMKVLDVDANYLFADVLAEIGVEKSTPDFSGMDSEDIFEAALRSTGLIPAGHDLTPEDLKALAAVGVIIGNIFRRDS